jgi:hypothetical protein
LGRRWCTDCAHTFTLSLKNAALFAPIGTTILTVLLTVDFIDTFLNVARGLVPAMKLPTSFVDWLASALLMARPLIARAYS